LILWNGPFLREHLHLLGFPQRFVHLVMLCVESSSFYVAINGSLYGFFPAKCRVRQGDPFSPYLFLVCMEYLSRMLKIASQQPDFHYHPKCVFHHICHLGFADDILLLCRGDRSSIQLLLEQLHMPQGYTLMQGNLLFILVDLESVFSRVFSKILVFL